MNTTIYTISGMTCEGCVTRVKATLNTFADNVEVTLNPPQVNLNNCNATLETLNKAISSAGKYLLTSSPAKAEQPTQSNSSTLKSWLATYYPLLLIFGFILLVTYIVQINAKSSNVELWMMQFMAGFFLVFSFFKLLNLRGFVDSYAMYDLLALRFKPYGYLYAFIELGLGIAYLSGWQPVLTNWLTLIVMTFSSLGVIHAVMNKQKIRCACLGAIFNLPMSTVTIIEDLLMAAMALWMLI